MQVPRAHGLRTVLFIALRQLWARRLLNGIAVGGVSLGVLVLIALSGMMFGLREKFMGTMLKVSPHLTIQDTELHPEPPLLARYTGQPVAAVVAHAVPSARQARIKRPEEIVRALEAMAGVQAAAASLPGVVLIAYGGKSRSVELRGIDPARQERVTPIAAFVLEGSLPALAIEAHGIAVGSGLAAELGLHLGDVVHAAAPGGVPLDLKVVAVFESGVQQIDKVRAYTLVRDVQALVGRPDAIGQIDVRLASSGDAVWMAERIERMFGYDAESWQEQNAGFLAVFRQQDVVLVLVIGAILLVGGFGILAIQIMIVLEKTRDIAILRSVGLRRGDILRVFLFQGAVIALSGAALGCACGKLALIQLARMRASSPILKLDHFLIADEPRFYLQGIGFALLVGLVASILPAWRAGRVEPVDVLRGQIG